MYSAFLYIKKASFKENKGVGMGKYERVSAVTGKKRKFQEKQRWGYE